MQKEELDCLHAGSAKQPASVPQAPGGRLPTRPLTVTSLFGATRLGEGETAGKEGAGRRRRDYFNGHPDRTVEDFWDVQPAILAARVFERQAKNCFFGSMG